LLCCVRLGALVRLGAFGGLVVRDRCSGPGVHVALRSLDGDTDDEKGR
jgi:hypothetical protein